MSVIKEGSIIFQFIKKIKKQDHVIKLLFYLFLLFIGRFGLGE